MRYNFALQHKTLKRLSPAVAASVADMLWSMEKIAQKVGARQP